MGKSKWFCPTAKPPPDHILKKYFKFFLRLTAMVKNTNKGGDGNVWRVLSKPWHTGIVLFPPLLVFFTIAVNLRIKDVINDNVTGFLILLWLDKQPFYNRQNKYSTPIVDRHAIGNNSP